MKDSSDKILAFITGDLLAFSVMSFSGDLVKAFLLGLVGGLGGLIAKLIWNRFNGKE